MSIISIGVWTAESIVEVRIIKLIYQVSDFYDCNYPYEIWEDLKKVIDILVSSSEGLTCVSVQLTK